MDRYRVTQQAGHYRDSPYMRSLEQRRNSNGRNISNSNTGGISAYPTTTSARHSALDYLSPTPASTSQLPTFSSVPASSHSRLFPSGSSVSGWVDLIRANDHGPAATSLASANRYGQQVSETSYYTGKPMIAANAISAEAAGYTMQTPFLQQTTPNPPTPFGVPDQPVSDLVANLLSAVTALRNIPGISQNVSPIINALKPLDVPRGVQTPPRPQDPNGWDAIEESLVHQWAGTMGSNTFDESPSPFKCHLCRVCAATEKEFEIHMNSHHHHVMYHETLRFIQHHSARIYAELDHQQGRR